MKIYFVTCGEKAAYVQAVDMKQAINKLEESKVMELTNEVSISAMDINGILEESKEEVQVNAITMTNGDLYIYPMKSLADFKKASMDSEVVSNAEYTEKAFILK